MGEYGIISEAISLVTETLRFSNKHTACIFEEVLFFTIMS